jgi:flagellar biosynthetic protein FlhB
MAENASDDKTEKPSAQKLRKAREEGQVARSKDVATAVGVIVGLKLLVALGPQYLEDFHALFARALAPMAGPGALDNAGSTLFGDSLLLMGRMVAPLAAVPLAVLVASMVPGGWVFNASHAAPKFDRIDPLGHLKRLGSIKHLGEVSMSLAKVGALVAVLWHVARDAAHDYIHLQDQTLDQALLHGAALMIDGVFSLAMVFVVSALIDLPLQQFVFLRGQRMSKREIKEELKTSEGRPEVRQRIRQLQHAMARRSVRKSVPTADVVIVNPEHYAVALKYDEARAQAPFVVAKGVDEMALYIRDVAREHRVEVVELPPLARALYHTSQVNQQIPAALYRAVAQVLTYVLQLQAFAGGRRSARPQPPAHVAVPVQLSDPT